jgi:hypothetical protein
VAAVTKQPDDIDRAVSSLKAIAVQRGHKPDWKKIDQDLRSYIAELNLARSTTIYVIRKDGSRKPYRRAMTATATITKARKLLRESGSAIASAKKLPDLLARFAVGTYGYAGQASLPRDTLLNYSKELTEIEEFISLHRAAVNQAIAEIGNTQGNRGTFVEGRIGTETVLFLRRFILLWHEATGRKQLGVPFENSAKELLDIGLSSRAKGKIVETGDLSRQIRTAKKWKADPHSEWDLITEIMNGVGKEAPVKPRRK